MEAHVVFFFNFKKIPRELHMIPIKIMLQEYLAIKIIKNHKTRQIRYDLKTDLMLQIIRLKYCFYVSYKIILKIQSQEDENKK